MTIKNQFAGIVPARTESQRCAGKMLRNFSDSNLTEIALSKFSKPTKFFNFYFAANDPELVNIAKKYPCKAIERDTISSQGELITDVLNYVKELEEENVIFINACSPFLQLKTVELAVQAFIDNKCLSLTAVLKKHTWYYTMDGKAVNSIDSKVINTKLTPPLFEVTHNIHIFNRVRFLKHGIFWDNKSKDPFLFEIDDLQALDFDTEFDFELVETLYRNKNRTSK